MAGVTRGSDLLARYGGDEFCMVMRQTNEEGVAAGAERLRRTVEGTEVRLASGEIVHVTISVGGAVSDAADPSVGAQLMELADAALYEAKANGRNRIELASPSEVSEAAGPVESLPAIS
jgi:diguanylate cyclase (GGDEF)-like protein